MYELTIKFDSIEDLRAYLDGSVPNAHAEIPPAPEPKKERTVTKAKAEPEPEDWTYGRLVTAVKTAQSQGKITELKKYLASANKSSFKVLEKADADELKPAIEAVEALLS
jgi:hypothetical protein